MAPRRDVCPLRHASGGRATHALSRTQLVCGITLIPYAMPSSLDAAVQSEHSEPSLPLCHPLPLRVLAAMAISGCRLSACGRGA